MSILVGILPYTFNSGHYQGNMNDTRLLSATKFQFKSLTNIYSDYLDIWLSYLLVFQNQLNNSLNSNCD